MVIDELKKENAELRAALEQRDKQIKDTADKVKKNSLEWCHVTLSIYSEEKIEIVKSRKKKQRLRERERVGEREKRD